MEIFENSTDECFGKEAAVESIEIKKCSHLQRMLCALRYYRLLKLESNENSTDLFAGFCQDVYKKLLHDHAHIISTHGQHIEYIYDKLPSDENYEECSYSECKLFDRYHRRTSANKEKADTIIRFYKSILDSMHNYLYHMFETGMRIRQSDINQAENIGSEKTENEDETKSGAIDQSFNSLTQHISKRRQELTDLDRFNQGTTGSNNKFILNTNSSSNAEIEQTTKNQSTFIDALLREIAQTDVSEEAVNQFCQHLKEEGHDSDSLEMDVLTHLSGSNIINAVDDDNSAFKDFLIPWIEEMNCM